VPPQCFWAFAACGVLVACGNASEDLGRCTIPPTPAEPAIVESEATQLLRWPSAASQPTLALVDESAIFWYEDNGAIWRLVRGGGAAELLRAAPQPAVWLQGFVADDDRIYWGEAELTAGFAPTPVPPGRLWTADKTNFDASLLLEVSDAIVIPAGVADANIYAHRGSFGGPLFRAAVDGGEPSDVPLPVGARLFGDRFLWVEPGADEEPGELWRARPTDLTPHSLGPIEGSEIDVGPDHVLWHRDRYDNGPPPVLYQSFVLIDERRGCTADMPAAGESISFATAVDAKHVYWHSYNKLGSVGGYVDGRPGPALPNFPLYRMHLDTGRIQRIDTPGFSSPDHSFMVGQDSENIYVTTPEALMSIRKPPGR
jgi:hypothetical protein